MWLWRKKPVKKDAPTILITGGLGFIFSRVTEYYVKKGWNVVVVDNLSEGSNPQIIDGSFKHINAHMANLEVVETIVAEQPDYIVHAAAIADAAINRLILEGTSGLAGVSTDNAPAGGVIVGNGNCAGLTGNQLKACQDLINSSQNSFNAAKFSI